MTVSPARRLVLAALVGLGACAALAAPAKRRGEFATVTFSDGFALTGEYAREMDSIEDANGNTVQVAKIDGFDVLLDGPKFVIFSSNAKLGGKIEKLAGLPPRTAYTTKLATRRNEPVGPYVKAVVGEFDDKWQRRLDTTPPGGGHQYLTHQVTSLDPYTMLIESPKDKLSLASHTTEEDPGLVLRLLSLHPELRDPPKGTPVDPERRLKIAQFLREVALADGTYRGLIWLQQSRGELQRLKLDAPPPWPDAVVKQAEKLANDIDRAEAVVVIDELEAMLKSGRYDAARRALAGYQPKSATADDLTRLAVVRANIEKVRPGYELAAARLKFVIETEDGTRRAAAHAALGGGPAGLASPRPRLAPETEKLLAAARVVLAELSPDTASRVEIFKDVAGTVELARSQGREPADKPAALLAYAVSGWAKGKNGADSDVAAALRVWEARAFALDYLREPSGNKRKGLLDAFLKSQAKPPAPDELSQLITLLPPPAPMDLAAPTWQPLPKESTMGVDRVLRMKTGPLLDAPKGVDYLLRLPPEYHHNRPYPVLIALPSPSVTAEQVAALLAEQCQRNGIILAVPEWSNLFAKQDYDWSGNQHHFVTATLRDVQRHFQVEADKVFLFGYGSGADLALDVGMAHPDLFAGVTGFGPNPPPQLMTVYWQNAQRLPVYLVTGELAGTFATMRRFYERWMVKGFPSLLTVYRGRGLQWFGAELPRMFEWMAKKSRVRGTASLRLPQYNNEPWQVLREGDDRYYWVGVARGGLAVDPLVNGLPKIGPVVEPAHFVADIGRGGVINITQTRGIRRFVIWLERDLIDWSKPIRITVNGNTPRGYKPEVRAPDLRLMLEELYRTGDRKLLFLGKIEVDGY